MKIKLFIILFFMNFLPVFAQETIFNVPNADITPKGRTYIMEGTQFNPTNPDAYFLNTIFSDFGIGHNTEVGATLFNVGAPATQNISMGVGFKTSMPILYLKEKFPEQEFKFTVGSEVLIGLENNGVGNWTYWHFSGRIPKLKTRVTAGMSYGTRQVFGNDKSAVILGVEQPINKKIALLTDWYSGSEHWAGYLIPGFSYALPKDVTIYAGYQIPNSPRVGRSGFVIQVAKLF